MPSLYSGFQYAPNGQILQSSYPGGVSAGSSPNGVQPVSGSWQAQNLINYNAGSQSKLAPTAVLMGNSAQAYNPNAPAPTGLSGYGGGSPGNLVSGMHVSNNPTYSYQPPGINPIQNGVPLGYQYENMINPPAITVYGTQSMNKFGNIAGSPAQGANASGLAAQGYAGGATGAAGGGTGTYQDILNSYLSSSNQNRQLDVEAQGRNYSYQTGAGVSDAVRRGMAGLYDQGTFRTGKAGTVPAALLNRVDRGNTDALRGINAGYDQRNSQFAAQVADIQLRANNAQISQQQAAAELAERQRQFDASLAQQRQLATLTRSGGSSGGYGGGGSGSYGGGSGGTTSRNPYDPFGQFATTANVLASNSYGYYGNYGGYNPNQYANAPLYVESFGGYGGNGGYEFDLGGYGENPNFIGGDFLTGIDFAGG